jgi:hypothetical protein
MPASPVSSRQLWTVAGAVALAWTGAAFAQSDAPYGRVTIEHTDLTVSGDPAPTPLTTLHIQQQAQVGPPVRLAPPGTAAAPSTPPAPPVPLGQPLHPLAPPGITVDQLPPPAAGGQGALGPNDHPLPADLWRGTSRAAIEALIPRIKPTTSPTLQDLAYRLLASPAAPPAADADAKTDAGAILAFRAERLTGLGRPDAALLLLQSAPVAGGGEDATRVITDLAFLSGDTRTACSTAHSRDPAWQGPYWDQATVACQAIAGKADEAQLGLDLLREAKVKDDGFSALVLKAVGVDAKLPDILPSPQTMSLALLQKAGQPLPKKALDAAPLAILRTVALGEGFPPDQRLAAAEKAAEYGAVAPERLAEAYLSTDLTDEDKQSPLNRAKAAGGARGRAILFQAAHDANQLTAKANFLLAYLGDAKSELFPALARAAASMLVEIPATEDLKSVAPDFARALYALDQPRQAGAWFEIAAPDGQAGLLPLAHVVAGDAAPPWAGTDMADLAGGKKDAAAGRRAAAAALLLAAEGVALPDRMLLPLADANAASLGAPPVGPAALLANAAAAKRLGGTLLASFAALGDQAFATQPVLAAQIVAALREVGLADEARRLAIDIAVADGL